MHDESSSILRSPSCDSRKHSDLIQFLPRVDKVVLSVLIDHNAKAVLSISEEDDEKATAEYVESGEELGDEESAGDELEVSDGDEDEDVEHEDDEDDDDGDDMDDADDCDLSAFVKANEKFNQLEESVANKGSYGAVSEEIRKGQSIAHQMKVWDKLLEYRIQFQKVLALANQLPPCDVFKQAMKDFLASPENARIYKHCVRNVEKAFEQLAAIREDLIHKYPEMKKSLDGKSAVDSDGDEIPSDDDDEIPSDIASGYSEDDDGQPKRKKSKFDEEELNGTRVAKDHLDGDAGKRKKFLLNEVVRTDEEFHRKLLPFR